MWVEVMKASGEEYWYKDMIGEYYRVSPQLVHGDNLRVIDGTRWPDSGQNDGFLLCLDDVAEINISDFGNGRPKKSTYNGKGMIHKFI